MSRRGKKDYLIPDVLAGLNNELAIGRLSCMGPEMMRSSCDHHDGTLGVRGLQHSQRLPGVNLTVGIQDTAALDLRATIHLIREVDVRINHRRINSKGDFAHFIIG